MKKIKYITDPEILAIPIIECDEPLVDIKQNKVLQYGLAPENELTENCYTKMRKTVFEKLCEAQVDLPQGWRFRLYEGFRSTVVQQMLFDEEYQRVMARYPHEAPQHNFYETTRLVSPVVNADGSFNTPAHNTGGAIDVEVIDQHNQLIDMGMALKDWGSVQPELCLTACELISDQAQKNRFLLCEIMERHGFINYPYEWWHFSYGDRYWAYYKNVKYAMYGSADKLAILCK